MAQSKALNGFTYSGEPFDDPDWGKSYRTSEQDRQVLSRANKLIHESLAKLLRAKGDYSVDLSDMSFAFDSVKQAESRKNGSKCVTCYYSQSPATGGHFQYTVNLQMDIIEESGLFSKKAQREDSLAQKVLKAAKTTAKQMFDKQLQSEMEKLQKEIAAIDYSKITESQLAEIERKGKRLEELLAGSAGISTMSDDSVHALYGDAYAQRIDLTIRTNAPMVVADRNQFTALKGKPDYFFKELAIPGCSFACIYFDKYNKSTILPHSNNYVFVAYVGEIYASRQSMPKPWLDPFCVQVIFSGNQEQIKEIREQIDFNKLTSILSSH